VVSRVAVRAKQIQAVYQQTQSEKLSSMEGRFGRVDASKVLRCNSTISNQAFNISF
jgi:hypothetical protein